jgi:uncharacterized protein with NRDE domain
MCLLVVAHQQHAQYRLIVAANRDEFHDRPALPATYWADDKTILGGRDLQGGGTWLAVNRAGQFAAITNVRTPRNITPVRSRGLIISDYLNNREPASDFISDLTKLGAGYEGFNLLASDTNSTAWYSNFSHQSRALAPGVYGLSNHLLDTPWPKVNRIKADFIAAQTLPEDSLVEALFKALANEQSAPDKELPDTGISREFEKILSPIFISGDNYGTRCSTVILVSHSGELTFLERRFGPNKSFLGESAYKFEIDTLAN